jgi:hypothetical protein
MHVFSSNYSFCFGVGLVLTVDGTVTAGSPVCVANCQRIEDGNDGSSDQDTHNSHSDSRYQKSVVIYMLYKNVFNWLKRVLNNSNEHGEKARGNFNLGGGGAIFDISSAI